MPKKTNKTSHVLSLLTNGAEPEEASRQDLAGERTTQTQGKQVTQETSQAGTGSMESMPKTPSPGDKMVVVVDDQEESISHKIFDDLAKQLETQKTQEKTQEQSESNIVAESKMTQKEGQLFHAKDLKADSNLKDQDADQGTGQEEYHIVNVMENIVAHTDLKKYMSQYGVCSCSRCCADVEALILTRLPSKYVVAHKASVTPMMGYYENKFRVRIFTEILKACLQVREKPRHEF